MTISEQIEAAIKKFFPSADLSSLRAELEKAQTSLKTANETIASLEKELSEVRQGTEKATALTTDMQGQIETLTTQLQAANTERDQARQAQTDFDGKVAAAAAKKSAQIATAAGGKALELQLGGETTKESARAHYLALMQAGKSMEAAQYHQANRKLFS